MKILIPKEKFSLLENTWMVLRILLKKLSFLAIVAICFLSADSVLAQIDIRDTIGSADQFFEQGHFPKAIEGYQYALKHQADNKRILSRLAQSWFEVGDFDRADSLIGSLLKEEQSPNIFLYYKAQIHHHRLEFSEAIKGYKKYLSSAEDIEATHRRVISDQIRRASSGLKHPGRRMDLLIENMGAEINSSGDEIRPLFSPNIMERIYFSSNGPGSTGGMTNEEGDPDSIYGSHSMDMYKAELSQGKWGNVEDLNPRLNSAVNDIALDFTNQGRVLYYFKGFSTEVGRVFSDTFGVDRSEAPVDRLFESPFVPELGDQGLSFVNDSVVFFSSNRPGGFGGYDIYMAIRKNGQWSDAINLGAEVNSPYDEVDPFVSNGGVELFFSSNRLSSIGQFDVFHARFDREKGRWIHPENVRMPLNSAGNDRFFRISNDGNTCVFASDRKGGHGGYDLYLAYFRQEWEDQFAFFSDEIYLSFSPLRDFVAAVNREAKPPVFIEFDPLFFEKTMPLDTVTMAGEKTEEVKEDSELPFESVEPEDAIIKVKPFYYNEDGGVLFPDNIENARQLASVLKENANLEVQLSAFSAYSGPVHLDLFFSINKAEELANILINEGVEPDRITAMGHGSQYPVALNSVNREPNVFGQQANRRIDVTLFEDGQFYNEISVENFILPDSYLSSKYDNFKEAISGLSYKVQIGAARNMWNEPALSRYEYPMIERKMSADIYRYTVGLKKSASEIKSYQTLLKKSNLEGAFIVPYIDGKRITFDEIPKFIGIFADLKNFN